MGFEAWRRLPIQFELKLVIRQGQVLAFVAALPCCVCNHADKECCTHWSFVVELACYQLCASVVLTPHALVSV